MKNDVITMAFKDNLKRLRELSGFTRVEMANHLNMTPAAYGAYELGKREPKLTKLCEIAALLHTSVDELLGYVPRNTEDNANRIINQYRAIGAIVSKNTIGKGFIVQIGPNRYRIESEEDLAFIYDKAMGEEMLIKCTKPIKITFLEMELCKYGAF